MTGIDASRPVRTLHVIHHLQPGGMEYGLVKLVNGLAGGRIESLICSTSTADPAMARQLAPGVRLVGLTRRDGNDPLLVWQLYRLFRRERPDIVHTHAWGTLVEGLVAARLARVPVVMHGEHGTLQLKPYQVRVQRWAWSRVDRLLSVSSRLAEKMSAAIGMPLERITVIRNGVDLSRFGSVTRAEARREMGIGDDEVVIGHAGRLVPVKDQAALVHAAALLRDKGLAFRVLIAGDGPLRADLARQIAELGLGDHVELLGHRGAVERFFAALDVYVLCSRSEGMPNTILEAMASGVPVVSTKVGGADELVVDGETGTLVPAGDVAGLCEALQRLVIERARRRAMGAAGQARVRAAFSVDAMVSAYQQCYLRALGAGHSRAG
jgi:sugar transferase (PEP-CTERM/EpsH1 system associated)